MNIEYLEEKDMESYFKLIYNCFNYKANKFVLDNNTKILVIKDNNKVVATVTILLKKDYIKNINIYELNYFCVDINYRNKGYGTKLLKQVEYLANIDNVLVSRSFG